MTFAVSLPTSWPDQNVLNKVPFWQDVGALFWLSSIMTGTLAEKHLVPLWITTMFSVVDSLLVHNRASGLAISAPQNRLHATEKSTNSLCRVVQEMAKWWKALKRPSNHITGTTTGGSLIPRINRLLSIEKRLKIIVIIYNIHYWFIIQKPPFKGSKRCQSFYLLRTERVESKIYIII